MNADVVVIPPKPPTVIERATAVFAAVPSEESLRELAKKSATITEITNDAGKDQCHASRMVLKNTRLEIERVGEEGREDAVQTSKAIIARQKALISLTKPEEDRLAAIQKTWDERIAAEKEAKILAEISRVNEIQRRIEGIRAWAVNAATQGSLLVGQMLAQANDYVIDPGTFEEFTSQATDALMVSRAALTGLLAQRKEHEADQARIVAEREELAKLRAEAAERERVARETQAKADADAKAERDRIAKEAHEKQIAEARAHAEQIRLDRERIAKEEADAKAIRDAEAKRLADERAENARIAAHRQAELDAQAEAQRIANAAEAQRLADDRAQILLQQTALAEAQKPKPEPVKARIVERPTAAQLIACIAGHYSVSLEMAEKWIRTAKVELQKATA
jgi:hypothetical protein